MVFLKVFGRSEAETWAVMVELVEVRCWAAVEEVAMALPLVEVA